MVVVLAGILHCSHRVAGLWNVVEVGHVGILPIPKGGINA